MPLPPMDSVDPRRPPAAPRLESGASPHRRPVGVRRPENGSTASWRSGAAAARPSGAHGAQRRRVAHLTRRQAGLTQRAEQHAGAVPLVVARPGARTVIRSRSASRPRRASARRAARLSGTRRRSVPARARRRSTRPARRPPRVSRASTRAGPRAIRSRTRTARPRWRRATRSALNARAGRRATGLPSARRGRRRAGHVGRPPVRLGARAEPPLADHGAVVDGRRAGRGSGRRRARRRGPPRRASCRRATTSGSRTTRPGSTQRSTGSAGGGSTTPNRWISSPPATAAKRSPPRLIWPWSSSVPVVVGEPALVVGLAAADAVDRHRLARPRAGAEQQRAAGAVPRRVAAVAHRAELERVGRAVGVGVGGDLAVLERAARVDRQARAAPAREPVRDLQPVGRHARVVRAAGHQPVAADRVRSARRPARRRSAGARTSSRAARRSARRRPSTASAWPPPAGQPPLGRAVGRRDPDVAVADEHDRVRERRRGEREHEEGDERREAGPHGANVALRAAGG